MGQYNKAVLTTAGENLIARALAGEIKLNITQVKTSDYAYPGSTDLKSLTDMQGIKQTAIGPETTVINDTMIQTRVLFSNEEISTTYYINNIGLYAMDGTEEVLFCIVTAETPDEMPQYNGVASTSYIYNIQNVVQDATEINISVNSSGTAMIQDVMERVDATGGDISETVIDTLDTVEDKYPVPAAGESVKRFFGKVLTFLRNIRPLTSNITPYVSESTGSDITGDGSQAKPFKTIQHAIDMIPKDLGGHTAIITVADGTYSESVNIIGFYNGEFRLYSNGVKTLSNNCRVDYIGIRYSTCLIVVAGFSIMTTTHDGISAESCTSVNIQYTRIVENALSSGKSGMSFWRCRAFSVWNCEISYHNVVLFAYNSQGVSNNLLAGTGNNYGLYSSYGSIITTIGTQPAATTALVQDAGGMFTYGNGSQISGPFTLGISCTWGNVSGGYVRHGIYSNGQAIITINIGITVTTQLSPGTVYYLNGFPNPPQVIALTCNVAGDFYSCAVVPGGGINLVTGGVVIPVGNIYHFSATYLTNL